MKKKSQEPERRAVVKVQHYRKCFGTESGQYVLNDLMKQSGFFGSNALNYEQNNALAAAHGDGMTDLMKYVLHTLGLPDTQAVVDTMVQQRTDTLQRRV